jgi:ADP-ribose pyrophosphatase
VIERAEVCRGRRFSLERVTVDVNGRVRILDSLRHPGAVAIVAVDDGKVLLERQYRPVVEDWVYELPAGTIEPGEPPERTAVRELVEETGYEPGRVELLGWFYTSPGVSTEKLYVYGALDLREVGRRLEDDEVIEVEWMPLNKVIDMVRKGEIRDAKTLAGLLLYLVKYGLVNTVKSPGES